MSYEVWKIELICRTFFSRFNFDECKSHGKNRKKIKKMNEQK